MYNIQKLSQLIKEIDQELTLCTSCGMCQAVCPLFNITNMETDVARGKLAMLNGLKKGLFTNPKKTYKQLNRCLLCGSCANSCPSGVNVSEIFIKARVILTQYLGLSYTKRIIFRKIISNNNRFNALFQFLAKFQFFFIKAQDIEMQTYSPRFISQFMGNRHLTKLAKIPFYKQLPVIHNNKNNRFKVAFYTGCLIDKIFPNIANACIKALTHHNVDIYIPNDQVCCGIPFIASGDIQTFNLLLSHNLALFEKEKYDFIVTPCATCTSTIKKIWPMMAIKNLNCVQKIADKTMDINQFFVNYFKIEQKTLPTNSFKTNVTWHDPCHLKKSLGIYNAPRTLINASSLYNLIEMENSDWCCGMGGSFNLQHYDISNKIGQKKYDNIVATKCECIATGCPACMIQIADVLSQNNSKIKIKHSIEIYAKQL